MEPQLTRLTLYFLTRVTELDDKQIKLRLWDTHGQDHFRSLTRSYFRGADGVVVAYSITDQASFDHLTGWLQELTEYASADINKVLIATKCDLAAERVVDYTTGKEFADSLGIPFFETSAKESTNVQTAFEALARQIFDRKLPEIEEILKQNATKQGSGRGCCY